jgi:hypothetical protein
MPRFNVEFSGVIDAVSQEAADALADHVADCSLKAHRYRIADGPDAVLARMSVEVVVPKIKYEEAA